MSAYSLIARDEFNFMKTLPSSTNLARIVHLCADHTIHHSYAVPSVTSPLHHPSKPSKPSKKQNLDMDWGYCKFHLGKHFSEVRAS